jgi:hypothetical protein
MRDFRVFILFFVGIVCLLAPQTGRTQGGLVVQSYDGTATTPPRATAPLSLPSPSPSPSSVPGVSQKEQAFLNSYAPPTHTDKPLQSQEEEAEYRGYNGRNLIQAYLSCKYETFRAAPPGDRSKGVWEKMRIRMYVMDVCMNREGFFRKGRMMPMDLQMITGADIML